MQQRNTSFSWQVGFLAAFVVWIAASVVGWLGLMVVIGLLFDASSGLATLAVTLLAGLASGAGMGALQWLVLRRWMSNPRGWVIATAVGFAVGVALAQLTPAVLLGTADRTAQSGIGLAAIWAVAGIISAIWQSLILGRDHRRASWWIVGAGIGWALLSAFTRPSADMLGQLLVGIGLIAIISWVALLVIVASASQRSVWKS